MKKTNLLWILKKINNKKSRNYKTMKKKKNKVTFLSFKMKIIQQVI